MATTQLVDIFASLKEQIIHYALKPRERLTEAALAERYGLSRTPVREALRKLEQEGWIIRVPHQGYYVRDFSLKEIEDIYEVRIGIERWAVRLAAERMSQEQYQDLHAFWSNPPDPNATWSLPSREARETFQVEQLKADEAFHEAIAASTGNAELLRHVRSLNERIRIIRRIGADRPDQLARTYREHFQILELIHQRRAEEAERAIEGHIRLSMSTIIQLAQEGLARVYLKS